MTTNQQPSSPALPAWEPRRDENGFIDDDAYEAEAERLYDLWLDAQTDPERFVDENAYNAASAQDWADLDFVRAWEGFEGFGS